MDDHDKDDSEERPMIRKMAIDYDKIVGHHVFRIH
jgi:hypothetical protein